MKQSHPERLFAIFVALLLVILVTQPAIAHGDEPRLEISAERLSPGSVLELRGVAFEAEEEITLTLVGLQNEIPFGSVLADTEGIFLLTITLPADLPQGSYVFRAATDDHSIESPPITILGSADLGEVEDGQREEEDPLFAPMPTVAPGPYPTSLPQTAASEPPAAKRNPPFLLCSILAGVVVLALLSLRSLKKR
jgi:hypothetical protein